jgi:hypothetical protein
VVCLILAPLESPRAYTAILSLIPLFGECPNPASSHAEQANGNQYRSRDQRPADANHFARIDVIDVG